MRFHHYAIEVNNLEESIAFYKKYLGFREESRFSFLGEEIVFLNADGLRLELISSQQKTENTTHLCFEVNDLHEIMSHFDFNRKIDGPYQLTNGWQTVFYEGPDGEAIEFLQAGSASKQFAP